MKGGSMPAFIYVIENTITGCAYVGKAKCVKQRWRKHQEAAEKSETFLYRSMRKYGIDSFVVHVVDSHEDEDYVLQVLEPEWISYLRMMGVSLYNTAAGGIGSTGCQHTDDAKERIRRSRLGHPMSEAARMKLRETNLGKSLTTESRDKISKANLGKKKPPRSAEHCTKISASKKGKQLDPKHVEKIREAMHSSTKVGHPIDESTREKIAEKLRGQVQSPETRAKRAESMKLAWQRRRAARESGTP